MYKYPISYQQNVIIRHLLNLYVDTSHNLSFNEDRAVIIKEEEEITVSVTDESITITITI